MENKDRKECAEQLRELADQIENDDSGSSSVISSVSDALGSVEEGASDALGSIENGASDFLGLLMGE